VENISGRLAVSMDLLVIDVVEKYITEQLLQVIVGQTLHSKIGDSA